MIFYRPYIFDRKENGISDGFKSYPRATVGSGLGRGRVGIPFLGQKYTVLIFAPFYQEKGEDN